MLLSVGVNANVVIVILQYVHLRVLAVYVKVLGNI